MSSDKIEPFKISDIQRREVKSFTQESTSQQTEKDSTQPIDSGFTHIEQVLEEKDLDGVVESFERSYEQLEALSTSKDKKKQAAAKKGMIAYERVVDLFEYLFATKASILETPREG